MIWVRSAAAVGRIAALDWSGFSLSAGLRAASAVALPVAFAEATGWHGLTWAAICGFWGCLADSGGPWHERFAAMASLAVSASVAVGAGLLVARTPSLAIVGVFACCFTGALARVIGNAAGTVGLLTSTAFLVTLGLPAAGLAEIPGRMALTLLGGLWAMFLVLVVWRLSPFAPLRQALAVCWRELARYADTLTRLARDPPAQWIAIVGPHRRATREAIERARLLRATERRMRGAESGPGQALGGLLALADRVFDGLIALDELIETDGRAIGRPIPAGLRRLARTCERVAQILLGNRVPVPDRIDPLRSPARAGADRARTLLEDLRLLARDGEEVAAGVRNPASLAEAIEVEVAPDRLDPLGMLGLLWSHLDLRSAGCRHALRVAVAAAFAQGLILLFDLPRGYWMTTTAIIILQPYTAATWRRAVERVGGTVLGGVLAAALSIVVHTPFAVSVAVLPLSIIALGIRALNYTLFVVALTPLFILIAELAEPSVINQQHLASLRALDAVLGGLIALVAGLALWPESEVPQLPALLAEALRRVAELLAAALDGAPPDVWHDARRRSGLAINAAEIALQRLMGEPRWRPAPAIEPALEVTGGVRRLGGIAAALALDRAHPQGRQQPPIVVTWIERSLEMIARALETATPASLPPAPTLADTAQGDAARRELLRLGQQIRILDAASRRLIQETWGSGGQVG